VVVEAFQVPLVFLVCHLVCLEEEVWVSLLVLILTWEAFLGPLVFLVGLEEVGAFLVPLVLVFLVVYHVVVQEKVLVCLLVLILTFVVHLLVPLVSQGLEEKVDEVLVRLPVLILTWEAFLGPLVFLVGLEEVGAFLVPLVLVFLVVYHVVVQEEKVGEVLVCLPVQILTFVVHLLVPLVSQGLEEKVDEVLVRLPVLILT
jgi:hypothetical protein